DDPPDKSVDRPRDLVVEGGERVLVAPRDPPEQAVEIGASRLGRTCTCAGRSRVSRVHSAYSETISGRIGAFFSGATTLPQRSKPESAIDAMREQQPVRDRGAQSLTALEDLLEARDLHQDGFRASAGRSS